MKELLALFISILQILFYVLSSFAVQEFSWAADRTDLLNNQGPNCTQYLLPDGSRFLLSPDQWNRALGEVWHYIVSAYRVPQDGIVVEIAPGNVEKVGLGFQSFGFQGDYYIIEPHEESLSKIAEKYKKLMPRAKIIPIQKTLVEAIPVLPSKVDAIVANHPLDDMIIGKSLSSIKFRHFFSKMYELSEEGLTREIWSQLKADSKKTESIISEIVSEWNLLISHTNPSFVAISQYPGLYHAQHDLSIAHESAGKVLMRLQSQWPMKNAKAMSVLSQVGHSPQYWFIYQAKADLNQDIRMKPGALKKLGEKIFVSEKARHIDPAEVEIAYINEGLLEELGYGDLLKDKSKLRLNLTKAFAVDLAPKNSMTTTEEVYVDRQADPLHIAMNGNLGSGRAIYLGSRFNIKGVGRTLLVVAPESSEHGNGQLDFDSSLWETVVSNSLYENLRTSSSPVLVVFRYKYKTFPAPWGDGSEVANASLIVRIDNRSLDRPVHIFKNPKLGDSIDLYALAARFAEQDAEKFIERIVHGAWSSGNISLEGHLIDMDTVTAVVGRSPQYSLTGKYIENLFGLEGRGQIRILQALTENFDINTKQISFASILDHFQKIRERHMQSRILDLFGINPAYNAKIRVGFENELNSLIRQFECLSVKMFPDFTALRTWSKNSRSQHVFDFSFFFRRYPIIRKLYKEKFERLKRSLSYLRIISPTFTFKENTWISNEVYKELQSKYVVKNRAELQELEANAKIFLQDFDHFFDKLEGLGLLGNENQLMARAYIRNEDRLYLTDSYAAPFLFKLSEEVENGSLPIDHLEKYIKLFIQANNRVPLVNFENEYVADFRIFKEGYIHRSFSNIATDKFDQKITIHIFSEFIRNSIDESAWHLRIDGKVYPLAVLKNASELVLERAKLDISLLLKKSVKIQLVQGNGEIFKFTDYSESTPRANFTIEVLNESDF